MSLTAFEREENTKGSLTSCGDCLMNCRDRFASCRDASHDALTELHAGCKMRAAQEFCGWKAFFSFKLQVDQFEPGVCGAGRENSLTLDDDLTGLHRTVRGGNQSGRNVNFVGDEFFTIEGRKCAGPGLKSAPAIFELGGRVRREVHAPVFALEQRSQRGAGMILRFAA